MTESLRESVEKTDRQVELAASTERGMRSVVLGTLASAVLAAVKIITGVLGRSYALIADGVESMLDIVTSLAVWGGLRIAANPPNDKYPYGYGKAEPFVALVAASGLLVAAVGIAVQSVREILTPHRSPAAFTLVVLVVVVVTKEVMFRILFRTGKAIGSRAVQTDAWHHRSDALTSVAAFIGISVALVAGEGYESADDWAALFATLVIAYNGVRLFRSSMREILDASPSPELVERVRRISQNAEGVVEIDLCRVRKSGLGLFVDIHVVVDGNMTVRKGHAIAHDVKDALLMSDLSVLDVVVHIEPVGEDAGQAVTPQLRVKGS